MRLLRYIGLSIGCFSVGWFPLLAGKLTWEFTGDNFWSGFSVLVGIAAGLGMTFYFTKFSLDKRVEWK